jgi:hypothetical protein
MLLYGINNKGISSMELSWTMKLRIVASAAVGVFFVSIVAWPWDTPPDPFGSLLVQFLGIGGVVTLLIMAFLAGLIAYFAAWPYGREIGILAVPFGLTVWAVRVGNVAALVQQQPSLAQRQMLFTFMRLEPFFWLLVIVAGFAGVTLGQKIRLGHKYQQIKEKDKLNPNKYLKTIIALVVSVVIAQFCISLFAQDVIISDNRLNSVVAQPAIGQIIFAVFVSFGIAAFVVKKYLNINYILPIISSCLITSFSIMIYAKPSQLSHLVEHWPAVFFSNVVVSILPIQMVTFGTLGSIGGYWMAVRYQYWREHESK